MTVLHRMKVMVDPHYKYLDVSSGHNQLINFLPRALSFHSPVHGVALPPPPSRMPLTPPCCIFDAAIQLCDLAPLAPSCLHSRTSLVTLPTSCCIFDVAIQLCDLAPLPPHATGVRFPSAASSCRRFDMAIQLSDPNTTHTIALVCILHSTLIPLAPTPPRPPHLRCVQQHQAAEVLGIAEALLRHLQPP